MTTAAIALTGWAVIAGFLLRANHRAHRKPTPSPIVLLLGRNDYPPPAPPTRTELAWLRSQPVEDLRGVDLAWRFVDVIRSARRAEQVQS